MKYIKMILEKKEEIHLERTLNGEFEYWQKVNAIILASCWLEKPIPEKDLLKIDKLHYSNNKKIQMRGFGNFFNKYNFMISDFFKEYAKYREEKRDIMSEYPKSRIGLVKW